MRVLVCGGRDFDDYYLLEKTLNKYWYEVHRPNDPEFIVIEGGARGADALAALWVKNEFVDKNKHLITFPADWDKHGKAAGPIRNQQMIDEGKPDLVIAFPTKNSRGTWDMIRRAEKHNIKTIIVEEA